MLDNMNSAGCGCGELAGLTDLMSVETAVECALAQVSRIDDPEMSTLDNAAGRITKDDIIAPVAMPLFDNAAMDGFALRCADLTGGDSLPVVGTVAAGDAPRMHRRGAALRIFTGAPLPEGADAVVMVERCVETADRVRFTLRPTPGDNIRRAGSDQTAGQMLIPAGTRLAPHHIGLLAANGARKVAVVRKPRVAVFSTGDELRDHACAPGQIPDANRPMLRALVRQAGADATDLGILPDKPQAIAAALRGLGARYDLILTSGAVSMGGKDHIREALLAVGGEVKGWRVALKPGKPIMLGKLGAAAFIGLPGNPFAVHVGFHLFVAPQIARLSGADPAPFAPVPARAGFDWTRKPGRAEVFPVRISRHDDRGVPELDRLGHSVSATLFPLARADGLAMVPGDTNRVRIGDRLCWHPFCLAGGQP